MERVVLEDGLDNQLNRNSYRAIIVTVLLRVPLLFIADSDVLFDDTGQTRTEKVESWPNPFNLDAFLSLISFDSFCLMTKKLCCLIAILMMKNSEISSMYVMYFRIGLFAYFNDLSYQINSDIVYSEYFDELPFFTFLTETLLFKLCVKLLIQGSLAVSVDLCLAVDSTEPHVRVLQRLLLPFMMAPSLLAAVGIIPGSMQAVISSLSLVPNNLLFVIWVYKTVMIGYDWGVLNADEYNQRIENFGLVAMLEDAWNNAKIPVVLRCYAFLRLIATIGLNWSQFWSTGGDNKIVEVAAGSDAVSVWSFDMTTVSACVLHDVELMLVFACGSYVALLGVASIVSVISDKIVSVFKWILQGAKDEANSFAYISAILFYILSLQSGLPDSPPEKRSSQLGKNLCLLMTAILLYIHSLVDTRLQSLAVSSTSKPKHIRALCVCLFVCVLPIVFLSYLWSTYNLSTWLIAVSIFLVEAVVKCVITLIIYSLTVLYSLWDNYSQDKLWESYDDWVFYVQSFGNSVQFVFAILLFLNGNYVLFFELGGFARAVMIVVHAYCNIWSEARKAWEIFWKRRTASDKVTSLRDATPEEIIKNDDVCPICYMNMTSAKLTRCQHLFHRSCLTKWLHKQESTLKRRRRQSSGAAEDTCPKCMEPLHKVDATSQTD